MTSEEARDIANAKHEQAQACVDPRIKDKLIKDADFYGAFARSLHAQELSEKLGPKQPAGTEAKLPCSKGKI